MPNAGERRQIGRVGHHATLGDAVAIGIHISRILRGHQVNVFHTYKLAKDVVGEVKMQPGAGACRPDPEIGVVRWRARDNLFEQEMFIHSRYF
jgi:hypothetical protein